MKYSAAFKQEAREALYGNWGTAVCAGFVASLFGAATGGLANLIPNVDTTSPEFSNKLLQMDESALMAILLFLLMAYAVLFACSLVTFLIGGTIRLGYVRFNLNLYDGKAASLRDLFSQFHRFGAAFLMNLLMSIYLFFWSMLFFIPGIVKTYSYAMTPYILLEHPELSANDAITRSRFMMDGNKWRLFCLELSFIGWELLLMLPAFLLSCLNLNGPLGTLVYTAIAGGFAFVGTLFLAPYQEAARAAFYREVSGTGAMEEPVVE